MYTPFIMNSKLYQGFCRFRMGGETKPFHFKFDWALAYDCTKSSTEINVQFSSAGSLVGINQPSYSRYTFSDKNFWRQFSNVR